MTRVVVMNAESLRLGDQILCDKTRTNEKDKYATITEVINDLDVGGQKKQHVAFKLERSDTLKVAHLSQPFHAILGPAKT